MGMKKQKMRAEIPCRTPPSKNQTEPYGASYGQKTFRAGPLNVAILCYVVLFVCYFALLRAILSYSVPFHAISRYVVLFRIILNKKGSPIGKLKFRAGFGHGGLLLNHDFADEMQFQGCKVI